MTHTEQVRQYLKNADSASINMPFVAAFLGMSVSALSHKLRAESESYIQLRDDERKARAAALLGRNRKADLVGVQRVTGVSAAHASRCIKRWFGATLPQLRESR